MSDELRNPKTELSAAKLALLRARMKQEAARRDDTIRRRSEAELDAPLSFAQQRLWFLDQFYPRSCAYNVPRVFHLTGHLDQSALQQALNSIVDRHEILRTSFRLVKEEPVQVVAETRTVPIQTVNLACATDGDREARALAMVKPEVDRP